MRSSITIQIQNPSHRHIQPTHVPGVPTTTVTLGIIVAHDTTLPLESLAQELDKLNLHHSDDRVWVDMVVVLSKGVINYTVQFPGGNIIGDHLVRAWCFAARPRSTDTLVAHSKPAKGALVVPETLVYD